MAWYDNVLGGFGDIGSNIGSGVADLGSNVVNGLGSLTGYGSAGENVSNIGIDPNAQSVFGSGSVPQSAYDLPEVSNWLALTGTGVDTTKKAIPTLYGGLGNIYSGAKDFLGSDAGKTVTGLGLGLLQTQAGKSAAEKSANIAQDKLDYVRDADLRARRKLTGAQQAFAGGFS